MLPEAIIDRDTRGQSKRASSKSSPSTLCVCSLKVLLIRQILGRSLYSSKAWIEKLDLTYELHGHRGCVNTLS